jgi:hypothetical protein
VVRIWLAVVIAVGWFDLGYMNTTTANIAWGCETVHLRTTLAASRSSTGSAARALTIENKRKKAYAENTTKK